MPNQIVLQQEKQHLLSALKSSQLSDRDREVLRTALGRVEAQMSTPVEQIQSTPASPVVNTAQHLLVSKKSTPVERQSTPVESTPPKAQSTPVENRQNQHPNQHPRPSVESTPVDNAASPVDNSDQQPGKVAERGGLPVWIHWKHGQPEEKTLAQVRSLVSTYGHRVRKSEERAKCEGGSCAAMDVLHRRLKTFRYWEDAKEQLEDAHAALQTRAVNR